MTNKERYLKNIRVISILTRLDRRTRINELLATHELVHQFSDAVIDVEAPMAACAKSHHKTLKEFFESATVDDEYLLILEDDCEFAENFEEKFNKLNIADALDWDSLRLGCLHVQKPIFVSDGLWQATFPLDCHCTIYKVAQIPKYLKILSDCIEKNAVIDRYTAEQIGSINVLTAYPNLAFQKDNLSDITRIIYSNYHENGAQKIFLDAVSDI